MNEEVKGEAVEISVTACEKHPSNNEVSKIHAYPFKIIKMH